MLGPCLPKRGHCGALFGGGSRSDQGPMRPFSCNGRSGAAGAGSGIRRWCRAGSCTGAPTGAGQGWWGKRSGCAVRMELAFDRCLRSIDAERNRGSLLRSSSSHPVSSSQTTPALISRLPLSRAAVPFGQWNVCNALWAPPVVVSRGCCRSGRTAGFPRYAVICGPFEAVSRCGQPGLLEEVRGGPLDSLRRA